MASNAYVDDIFLIGITRNFRRKARGICIPNFGNRSQNLSKSSDGFSLEKGFSRRDKKKNQDFARTCPLTSFLAIVPPAKTVKLGQLGFLLLGFVSK